MERLIYLDGKKIDISGPGGNAFAIIGKVTSAMRQCGVKAAEIDAFHTEAMSGDYNHLIEIVEQVTGIVCVCDTNANSDYL